MQRRPLIIAGLIIGAIVALPLGWYLISPLFIDRAVDEAFPGELPAPSIEVAPAEATAAMEEALAAADKEMEEPMPEEDMSTMTILRQGAFYDLAHEGQGTATIYELADGSRILRFEDFEVLNGPELHVYLTSANPVPDGIGTALPDGLDLGLLKGNVGNQNYELPADLDLSLYNSVVIWCEPFRVPFNAASLDAP